MATDKEILHPDGTLLSKRQARFFELLADGLRVQDAELLAGMAGGAIGTALIEAREAAGAGRKPSGFGTALLVWDAKNRAKEKQVEEDLLDEGGMPAVQILKERKKDRRAGIKEDDGLDATSCGEECRKALEFQRLFNEGMDRVREGAAKRAMAKRKAAKSPPRAR